ncbi:MAG TPA: hypothetical protein VG317_05205 [Pseudonocardiaceae bacterium]|jgi:hypothetical protein|nr:hypothetical protein [Pseudonocardiaceae bacterium]
MLLRILGGLLVVWVAFMVLGFVIKGLIYLAVIGLVLAAGTAAYTAIRNRNRRQLPPNRY